MGLLFFFWLSISLGESTKGRWGTGPPAPLCKYAEMCFSCTQCPQHFSTYDMTLYLGSTVPNPLDPRITPEPF